MPGEMIYALAAQIRQDATTCVFHSIQNPQDEALRQRFICSINNKAALKALFKVKDDQVTFAKPINFAIEMEDPAKVAKGNCLWYHAKACQQSSSVFKIYKQEVKRSR